MSSFLIMFTATSVGILLAVPTVGLSLLLPVIAWGLWVKPKADEQRKRQPQPEPKPQRSWFFGFFWW